MVIHHLIPGTGEYPAEDEYLTCGLEPDKPMTATRWEYVTCKKCLKFKPKNPDGDGGSDAE